MVEWFIIVWLSCPIIIQGVAPLSDVCEFTWSRDALSTEDDCEKWLLKVKPAPPHLSGAVGKCISIKTPGRKT